MKIGNAVHKGLRRFIESDDASGLQPAVVSKIRRMVTFLQDMEREGELRTVPSWKAHLLTGDRKGTWSLFVTKNWANDVSDRSGRDRDHRPGLRGLPLGGGYERDFWFPLEEPCPSGRLCEA
jgi:proteic killer suppression protein